MASAKGLGILSLVTCVNIVFPLPIWANLIVFTLVPIYIGALRSRKLSPWWDIKDLEDSDISVIGSKEALKFPLVASAVLLSLYVAIKYISPQLVNLLISLYLLLIGVYCVKHYIYLQLKSRKILEHPWKFSKQISIPYIMPTPELLELNIQDLVAFILAAPIGIGYFFTKNWILCNIMGIALSIHALENMPISSFKIAFGLLAALLVYDVFFVFGTDVMLTVAKNIDGPIKLLFPKATGGYSMIGLGDIIMPGILITMTLRYDVYRIKKNEKKGTIYFYFGLAGYLIGIIATVIAMKVMEREQPALLYLVPTCIISVLAAAIYCREFSQLWLYNEENNES